MGKNKPVGHYCRICGRHRTKEKFGGRGHGLPICKDCQHELKREARQKGKAGETDALLPDLRGDLMDMNEDDLESMIDQMLTSPSAKVTSKKGIPYEELDANIVGLVQVLNLYPGVMSVGSCGGHEVITNSSQWQSGTWYVKFTLSPDKFGWYEVQHLAWCVNEDYQGSGRNAILLPTSPPPYLNTVGQCLHFVIEGYASENPDELAKFLDETRKYVTKKRR